MGSKILSRLPSVGGTFKVAYLSLAGHLALHDLRFLISLDQVRRRIKAMANC